jgi:hypothetical protein
MHFDTFFLRRVRRFNQTPTGGHGAKKKKLRTSVLYSNRSRQLIFLFFLPPALLYFIFSCNVFEHATENLNNNNNCNYNGGMERRDQVLCISIIREIPGSTIGGFLWNSSVPS